MTRTWAVSVAVTDLSGTSAPSKNGTPVTVTVLFDEADRSPTGNGERCAASRSSAVAHV